MVRGRGIPAQALESVVTQAAQAPKLPSSIPPAPETWYFALACCICSVPDVEKLAETYFPPFVVCCMNRPVTPVLHFSPITA